MTPADWARAAEGLDMVKYKASRVGVGAPYPALTTEPVMEVRMAKSQSTPRSRPSVESRFWAKVDKNGPIPEHRPELGPCWLWTGGTWSKGYGQFWNGQRGVSAHCYAYEIQYGSIPDGLQVDHLCRALTCVNAAHLEAVTGRVNVLRGTGPTAINISKTHCPKGHPYDLLNTFWDRKGYRKCRSCEKVRKINRRIMQAQTRVGEV